LNGKKELIFPDDELREMGVRLRVIPPAGVTKALEKIKLIATKRNLDLPQGMMRAFKLIRDMTPVWSLIL
jgi:hypothetical protein